MLKPLENYEGELKISVDENIASDSDGFTNIAATPFVLNSDTIVPTVVIHDSAETIANSTVTYTFVFSEAMDDFSVDDITVLNGVKSASFSTGSNGDKVYKLDITPTSNFKGIMSVSIDSNVTRDIAGNTNIASLISTQAINTVNTVYERFGKLALEINKNNINREGLVSKTFVNEISIPIEVANNFLEFENIENNFTAKQVIESDFITTKVSNNDFGIRNTMMPSFELISLSQANLTLGEEDEFLFDYWINTLAI